MFENAHTRLHLPSRTLTWSLDYETCTTDELRKFLEERTGTALDEGQLQKVRDHGSCPLIDRLQQMDREATFPRFMELAPELRLGVYEALLIAVESTPKHKEVSTLHPAVLRTSKQVYSEAVPVLYKKNKFRAVVKYSERTSYSHFSGVQPICSLTIERPGGGYSFRYRTEAGHTSLLRGLFEQFSTMHMLRMLTHLAIDLDLTVPRGREESWEYSIMACHTMKRLCSTLSGASELKELTINGKPGDQGSKAVDLVDILWPLLFLRKEVKVKFEGISAGEEAISKEERSQEKSSAFGQRIALIRHLCNAKLGRPGWEERCWEFHGLREAEKALSSLNNPGKQLLLSYATPEKELLSLDDIVNRSPVWEGIRREIDRVETAEEQ